jgi:hypothetical protein
VLLELLLPRLLVTRQPHTSSGQSEPGEFHFSHPDVAFQDIDPRLELGQLGIVVFVTHTVLLPQIAGGRPVRC